MLLSAPISQNHAGIISTLSGPITTMQTWYSKTEQLNSANASAGQLIMQLQCCSWVE